MPRFNTEWTVQPHGVLEPLGARVLTVASEIVMPLGRFPRRMSVVRLADCSGVIYSAIPLAEPAMRELEAFARPTVLVIPNPHHRLDAAAWLARYPELKVLAPKGARSIVEEAVRVDRVSPRWDDPAVRLTAVSGTAERELALSVDDGGEITLIVCDVLANVRHPHGLGAQVMARLFGFGVDRPRLPKAVRKALVADPTALAGQYRRWAALPGLKRVVPAHGDVLDHPEPALLRMAEELDGDR